jgi:RHS repeat-associated protein
MNDVNMLNTIFANFSCFKQNQNYVFILPDQIIANESPLLIPSDESPSGDNGVIGPRLSYQALAPNGADGSPTIVHFKFYIVHCWTFTFSAKEKDVETGLSYFGSRYYSSDLSIWLSVDPMAAKYASLSPYTYCYNNPILVMDPNGKYGVISIKKQVDENGNVTGGTATLVMNYYYNSSMTNSMTKEQAQQVEDNIITNLNQLKGQKVTIDGVQYTFDYQIGFKDLATEYGSGNPERWAFADKYKNKGPQIGNYLQAVELKGGDVGQGAQYIIGIDFKKLKQYVDCGRSDGQTPIHEFFHNLGAVDTFVYGTRIMDYNHQVNGEPVPTRQVQMEDIERLINQSNNMLKIVYEN